MLAGHQKTDDENEKSDDYTESIIQRKEKHKHGEKRKDDADGTNSEPLLGLRQRRAAVHTTWLRLAVVPVGFAGAGKTKRFVRRRRNVVARDSSKAPAGGAFVQLARLRVWTRHRPATVGTVVVDHGNRAPVPPACASTSPRAADNARPTYRRAARNGRIRRQPMRPRTAEATAAESSTSCRRSITRISRFVIFNPRQKEQSDKYKCSEAVEIS